MLILSTRPPSRRFPMLFVVLTLTCWNSTLHGPTPTGRAGGHHGDAPGLTRSVRREPLVGQSPTSCLSTPQNPPRIRQFRLIEFWFSPILLCRNELRRTVCVDIC